jgi:ABC-type Fe3+ transport system substrate-binding protein
LKKSNFVKNYLEQEFKKYESSMNVTLEMIGGVFPYVKDRDTLPICWFDIAKKELKGKYCKGIGRNAWQRGTGTIMLGTTSKSDFYTIVVNYDLVRVDIK